MNREQGEGWAVGLVGARLRAAGAGTDPGRPGAPASSACPLTPLLMQLLFLSSALPLCPPRLRPEWTAGWPGAAVHADSSSSPWSC